MARDLARHQIFGELCDATLRAQALAHAAECAACAARLADERSLAAGLRALAAQDEPLAAPASVEAALLTAFRQQAQGSAPSVTSLRSRAPRWLWAAAAILLIGILTLAVRGRLSGNSQASSPNVIARATPTVTPVAVEQKQSVAFKPNSPATDKAAPKQLRVARKRPSQREQVERYLVESEIATDFLPLSDAVGLSRPERLQIIRVNMPRVALASFGLPMSFERATEPVQADLVVGSDGLPRAIRFVQSSAEPEQIISANQPPSSNEKER
jgi:hypothetical protein